jgi:ABC-type antimicrobial peptide transport system ATPase subunit
MEWTTQEVDSTKKVSDNVVVPRQGALLREGRTGDLTDLDFLQLMSRLDHGGQKSVAIASNQQLRLLVW